MGKEGGLENVAEFSNGDNYKKNKKRFAEMQNEQWDSITWKTKSATQRAVGVFTGLLRQKMYNFIQIFKTEILYSLYKKQCGGNGV